MSRIGFVSTWFERGASYVTRHYIDLLKDKNEIFVFARGGEHYAKGDPKWDWDNVTWGKRKNWDDERIYWHQFKKWIKDNQLDILFFNEQRDNSIVIKTRLEFPELIVGSYMDYYTVETVKDFDVYDFLICNTKRHYSVFQWHRQCFYVKWGTDTDLFKPSEEVHDELTFFHSAGVTDRKGLVPILKVFMETDLHTKSKLVIHIQVPLQKFVNYSAEELKNNNVEVIERTVSAPGLFYKGDVYVYPTRMDGLGLTLYEALGSGLPVIGTDIPPINEIIDDSVGRLVRVKEQTNRIDNYYWPISIIDEDSLYQQMKFFVEHKELLEQFKKNAREKAVNEYSWANRREEINNIFDNVRRMDNMSAEALKKETRKKYIKRIKKYYDKIKMDIRNLLTLGI